MPQPELDRRLAALASLGDPLRRALYRSVTSRDGGVGRDEAAAAVGVSRALAAYHLDKLVEAGLLDTRFERRTGRRGPGAGRTAKLYLRSASPVEVALPARDYELEVHEANARVDAERLAPDLSAALATLPPTQRQALQLRVIEELPYRQVARSLDCSEVAARVRVTRAIDSLSRLLKGTSS